MRLSDDPKKIVSDGIKDWARSPLGLKGLLGESGFAVSTVDTAETFATHVVVPVPVGATGERVFKITVTEVRSGN